MHSLGLKLWSVNTDYYYDEAVRLYEEGVYDYIELYIVPGSIATLAKWMELEVPFNIHAPHFAHGFNLAKEEKKASNLEIYREVKEFADMLMAEYIVFHGGIDGSINETAKQLAGFADARAFIENKPFRALPSMGGALCRGYNVSEIETVMDISGCGFCFDIGHAVCAANSQRLEPYSYLDGFVKLSPSAFHLTDVDDMASEYDSHIHLGEGELDLKKVLGLIPENALITVETMKNSKENLDDFIIDMEVISNATTKNS